MSIKPQPHKHLWVWFLWVALFYGAWLFLLQADGAWASARDHWLIALAMAIGIFWVRAVDPGPVDQSHLCGTLGQFRRSSLVSIK